jgi:hypothetical protein
MVFFLGCNLMSLILSAPMPVNKGIIELIPSHQDRSIDVVCQLSNNLMYVIDIQEK